MAGRATDPLAHGGRVGPRLQHDLVVVRFEQQHRAAAQQVAHARGGTPQIVGHADRPAGRVRDDDRDRLARVMRSERRRDGERSAREAAAVRWQRDGGCTVRRQRRERAGRRDQRRPGRQGEGAGAPRMIAVLVGEHDAGERREGDAGDLRPAREGPGTEPGIDQQRLPSGAHRDRVAPAARAQHRELHVPVACR